MNLFMYRLYFVLNLQIEFMTNSRRTILTRFLFFIRFKSLCDCALPGAEEPHSAKPIPEYAQVIIDSGITYWTTTSNVLYQSIIFGDRFTFRQNGQSSDTNTTRWAYAIGELRTKPATQIKAITHMHWVLDVLALKIEKKYYCVIYYKIWIIFIFIFQYYYHKMPIK